MTKTNESSFSSGSGGGLETVLQAAEVRQDLAEHRKKWPAMCAEYRKRSIRNDIKSGVLFHVKSPFDKTSDKNNQLHSMEDFSAGLSSVADVKIVPMDGSRLSKQQELCKALTIIKLNRSTDRLLTDSV